MINKVYLYGSVALGEDDQASDVDILIVGRLEKEEILELVEKMREKLRKEVKPRPNTFGVLSFSEKR